METGERSIVEDLKIFTSSDWKWAGCQMGLEVLEKLLVQGHHLQARMIKNLLKDIDQSHGAWALMVAKVLKLEECVGVLEGVGVHVGYEDSSCRNILHIASGKNCASTVRLILEAERKLLVRTDIDGYSALHMSADEGTDKVLEVLLSQKANPNWRNPEGFTALHLAAARGHLRCVALLLENGATVDAVNFLGETPLLFAAQAGHVKCMELLIEKGADLNWKTRNGQTALRAAVYYNREACVHSLLKAGVNVNKSDPAGYTALYHAALRSNVSVIGLLLSANADVEARSRDKERTALHICAITRMVCHIF